ncbi:MAG: twin-arginine translocation signal domain-containing protein [Desulfobulbaceae bacterium]
MPKNYSDERRNFLKTVALLSGAAACIPLAQEAGAAGNPPPPPPEQPGQGYRETEHISKYYQTARN